MRSSHASAIKTLRMLAVAAIASQAGAVVAQTSVNQKAEATIRVEPYRLTANYDTSQSVSIQGTGIAGFNLSQNAYSNPLDYLKTQAVAGLASGSTTKTSSLLGSGTTCTSASGQPNVCKAGSSESALLGVSGGNATLADVYTAVDPNGTFSLDISTKNRDVFTKNTTISAPSAGEIGIRSSGASTYNVYQQGVAGMSAELLSPTKVTLNTDAAGGGSAGIIGLTTSSVSNGVQETYSTKGSVSIDGASAFAKANTSDHIAVNATNAQVSDTSLLNHASGGTVTFINDNVIAVSRQQEAIDASTSSKTILQTGVLADANYITKDSGKGATSLKITNSPSDPLRTFVGNKADNGAYSVKSAFYIKADGTAETDLTKSVTAQDVVAGVWGLKSGQASDYASSNCNVYTWSGGKCHGGANHGKIFITDATAKSFVSNQSMLAQEAAPDISLKDGTITIPNFSSQQLSASGTSWVSSTGVTSSQQLRDGNAESWNGSKTSTGKTLTTSNKNRLATNQEAAALARGSNAVSNVTINSASGGGGQNSMTSGGFGNTVSMTTEFNMTVFGN